MPVPTLEQVRAWIQVPATVLDDPSLQQVYDAEINAQVAYCLVADEAAYPAELAQALYRRVGIAVARKGFPLGVISDEFGPVRISQWDAELERLEGPHRVIPVA